MRRRLWKEWERENGRGCYKMRGRRRVKTREARREWVQENMYKCILLHLHLHLQQNSIFPTPPYSATPVPPPSVFPPQSTTPQKPLQPSPPTAPFSKVPSLTHSPSSLPHLPNSP